ncbi:Dihydrolipoamide dehydrogenase of branched-chain alpha-keto acid dehydrogenase [Staphylococcus aureus]|uniref:Dihydrolipoamide dehydrogenase of branched-chain alpha-keto acid dehydrogenase n=1 Tax=Staphylococcus aureus TaxID=1280 RepID=A0A380E327_STAAU|nr:Dihydrolipoamide dehydrogenase of branched-chain alpha-keto acid dehydrogenase [Staphylococcus aureus]
MSARGVKFYEGIKLSENDINVNEDGVTFEISSDIIKVDKVLLSIGRKPNTSDIGLNNTKIKLSTSGHILTNEFQQTEDKHIYAAGDCIGKITIGTCWIKRRCLWLLIICLKGTQSQ